MSTAAQIQTTVRVQPDERKFRELILYIAQRCVDDPGFGATKLNKLLFHADFLAYGQLGQPITGVEYMKLRNGPAPRRLVPVRDSMVEGGEIHIWKRPQSPTHRPQERILPEREPDLSVFSPQEVALVDLLIQNFWGQSGEQMSQLTHGYRGWRIARSERDTIPYGAVFLSDEPPTDYDREHARELIERHGWDV
jgi:hypothetical protein